MIGLKRADRLVARHVLGATLLALAVFLGIDALSAFVREIDEIGSGDYTLTMAITYVAYTIPRRIYELFPMAAAIGGAMGLGGLAPTSELTALRAAGWSKQRLCAGALLPLLVLALAMFGLGETLAPWGERAAQGVAIGATVATLAASMRAKALDQLERDADKANANLSGPTIGFVVTTIIFLAYPLAMRIGEAFGG